MGRSGETSDRVKPVSKGFKYFPRYFDKLAYHEYTSEDNLKYFSFLYEGYYIDVHNCPHLLFWYPYHVLIYILKSIICTEYVFIFL